jgi:hypothetical protein
MPLTLARVVAVSALMTLVAPGIGFGHDGFTGITLDPPRVNPGGVVVITGHQVATDEPVVVSLAGPTGRAQLATAVTDGQGHFTVGPTIPAGTPTGGYRIEVSGQAGVYMSTNLLVEGSPIFEGNGAPAGQDEGLPGLPSVPAPGSTGDPAPRDVVTTATSPDIDLVPIVALVLAVGALGFLAWRTRRPTASQTGSTELP